MKAHIWRAYLPSLLLFLYVSGCGDDDGGTASDAGRDAGRIDSGRDSGSADSGPTDSGRVDTGTVDSGTVDTGVLADSGPVDSGQDTGPSCIPTTEVCDGIDNDCNPATPDGSGEATFGNACDGADSDACLDDTMACNGTTIACSAGTDSVELAAMAATCTDNVDNDCNGFKDALDPTCNVAFSTVELDSTVGVGAPRQGHPFITLVADSSNNLHGVYQNNSNDDFYYVNRTGTTWGTAETIDSRGIAGRQHSIIINKATGRLNAAWLLQSIVGGTNVYDLYFADRNPDWTNVINIDVDPVGTPTVQTFGIKMAQAPNNDLYVVYHDGRTQLIADGGVTSPGQDIYFAKSTNGGATWTSRGVIEMGSDLCRFPRLVIDSTGNLHVVYENTTLGQLVHATSANGGISWTITPFGPAFTGNAQSPSATIDSSNNIHVVYYNNADATARDIMYTKRTGTTWSTPVAIDTAGEVGIANSITVNAAGNVFVCYYDNTNKDLKFARSVNGTTWLAPEVIDSGTDDFGNGCSVAVDTLGYLHILYVKAATVRALKYATTQP